MPQRYEPDDGRSADIGRALFGGPVTWNWRTIWDLLDARGLALDWREAGGYHLARLMRIGDEGVIGLAAESELRISCAIDDPLRCSPHCFLDSAGAVRVLSWLWNILVYFDRGALQTELSAASEAAHCHHKGETS